MTDKDLLGETALVPGGLFPDDLDTTSLALTVLRPSSTKVSSLLDMMANYVNDDGNFQARDPFQRVESGRNGKSHTNRHNRRTSTVIKFELIPSSAQTSLHASTLTIAVTSLSVPFNFCTQCS